MKYKVLFLITFLIFSVFALSEKRNEDGKYIFMEVFTSLSSCMGSLLIKEGSENSVVYTKKYDDFRKYSFCSSIPIFPRGNDYKGPKYRVVTELRVKKLLFIKLLNLVNELDSVFPDVIYMPEGSRTFCKRLLWKPNCEDESNLVITVKEKGKVVQILLNRREGIFFIKMFDSILKKLPHKILSMIPSIKHMLETEYSITSKSIFAFTVEAKSEELPFIYCSIGFGPPNFIIDKVGDYLYKKPLKTWFFWNPEEIKDTSKVYEISINYVNRKIKKLLYKIRSENKEKRFFLSWNAFCIGKREINLDEREVMISMVKGQGVEYYKLKKSDPNVKELLKIVYNRLKK